MKQQFSRYLYLPGMVFIVLGLILVAVNEAFGFASVALLGLGVATVVVQVTMNFAGFREQLTGRSVRYGSNAMLMALIAFAILILINVIAGRRGTRFDLTAAKQFSLAPQTHKILQNLDKDVHAMAFFRSENKPLAEDLLGEYTSITGKFSYEVIDPDKKPAVAKSYSISAYGTIVLECEGKTEKITDRTEEALTNALKKVTREGRKKIYFTTGHGEHQVARSERDGMSAAEAAIKEENYEIATVNVAKDRRIPSDCTVLVVAGPQTDYFPFEKQAIDSFMNGGGNCLFMLEPPPATGLKEIMSNLSVEVGDNIVVDASPIGRMFGAGPSMPLVTKYETHEITKDFALMSAFPVARSVAPTDGTSSDLSVQTLFKSGAQSWGETDYQTREVGFDEGRDLQGPVSLAVVATRDLSGGDARDSEDTKNSRVVVVGDSDFATNAYFRVQGNGDLFLNMISWLAEEEDLISIRARDPEDRRVNLTARQNKIIFFVVVIILPLLVLVGGIVSYIRHRG